MDDLRKYFDSLYDNAAPKADCGTESALCAVKQRLGIHKRGKKTITAILSSVVAASVISFIIMAIGRNDASGWNELRVPDGQTAQLSLPDGSVLILNGGSRATYPASFASDQRLIFLEGEVLADIAKDSRSPFVVRSGDITVNVHGTRFDFKSYEGSSIAELILMEGSVGLDLNDGRSVTLTPGDYVRYDKATGDLDVSHKPEGPTKTFADGKSLHFIDMKMSDIAFELERTFGTNVVVTDNTLAEKRFFAYFTNGESLDDILSSFNSDGNMEISKKDQTVYLSTRKEKHNITQ